MNKETRIFLLGIIIIAFFGLVLGINLSEISNHKWKGNFTDWSSLISSPFWVLYGIYKVHQSIK
jgi:hypothetical protein